MAKDYRIGPCRILVANSLTDPVEDWTDLGETRGDVVVRPEVGRYAVGKADQLGTTPAADAVWDLGPEASCIAPLLEHTLSKLQKIFPSSVLTTASGESALGMGNGTAKVTPKAFCLVPVDEYTAGEAWWDAAHAVWFPKGVARQVDAKTLRLPEGDDAFDGSGFVFQFRALLADSSMPASCRTIGIGPIWKFGAPVLGIDFVLEAGHDASAVALIGGTKTFTRTGTAWGFDATTGKLTAYGTDVIRRESKGWLIEPQRSNKCQRNYLHGGAITGWTKGGDAAATLTAVTDAVQLAASGLDVICSDSYVLKLDNSGGATDAVADNAGVTGNTNPHVASLYARGTGTVRYGVSGVTADSSALTSAYQRFSTLKTPSGAGNVLRVIAPAGSIIYFVLAQLEEGAFATSPIPNNTAGTVTRNADNLSYAYTKAVDETNGVSVQVDFAPLYNGATVAAQSGLFALGTTAGDYFQVIHPAVTGPWRVGLSDGSTTNDQALVGETFPAAASSEVTAVYDPALAKKWRLNDGDADVTPAAAATAAPGGQWGGSVIRVGYRHDGSSPLGGHVSRFVVVRGNRTPAKLRKLKRAA